MKKLVPVKGYVLISFEPEGELQVSKEVLVSQKRGLVIDVGGPNNTTFNPDIKTGNIIYFTNYTGSVIYNENGVYAFVGYTDIIGKEEK